MIRLFMVIGILTFCFSGCFQNVQPWEKDVLANEFMQESPNKLIKKYHDHTYYSKEATKAGTSISGGGCGCN